MLAIFYKKSIYLLRHCYRYIFAALIVLIPLAFSIKTSPDKKGPVSERFQAIAFGTDAPLDGEILLQLKNAHRSHVRDFNIALHEEMRRHNVIIRNISADESLPNGRFVMLYNEPVLSIDLLFDHVFYSYVGNRAIKYAQISRIDSVRSGR